MNDCVTKKMERGGREADSKNVSAARVWKWKVLIRRESSRVSWNQPDNVNGSAPSLTHFLILLATHMWSVSHCNYFITNGFLPMKMKYIVAHTLCLLLKTRPQRRILKKYNRKFRTVSHYIRNRFQTTGSWLQKKQKCTWPSSGGNSRCYTSRYSEASPQKPSHSYPNCQYGSTVIHTIPWQTAETLQFCNWFCEAVCSCEVNPLLASSQVRHWFIHLHGRYKPSLTLSGTFMHHIWFCMIYQSCRQT